MKLLKKKFVCRIIHNIYKQVNNCLLIICTYFKCLAADESTTINAVDNKVSLRSVLVYVRNKSSKKSVSWRQENDLVQVSYFENDETERGMLLYFYLILIKLISINYQLYTNLVKQNKLNYLYIFIMLKKKSHYFLINLVLMTT